MAPPEHLDWRRCHRGISAGNGKRLLNDRRNALKMRAASACCTRARGQKGLKLAQPGALRLLCVGQLAARLFQLDAPLLKLLRITALLRLSQIALSFREFLPSLLNARVFLLPQRLFRAIGLGGSERFVQTGQLPLVAACGGRRDLGLDARLLGSATGARFRPTEGPACMVRSVATKRTVFIVAPCICGVLR